MHHNLTDFPLCRTSTFSTVAALDTTPKVYTPSASGKKVVGNSKAKIDISNVDQGYLMVRYNGNSKKVKLQITKKGSTTYTYNLSSGSYEAFLFLKAAEPIL